MNFFAKPNSTNFIYIQSDIFQNLSLKSLETTEFKCYEKTFNNQYLILIGINFQECVEGEIFRPKINA